MKCSKFEKYVMKYFDDSLSAKEKKRFLFHVQNCPYCKMEFEKYTQVIQVIQEEKTVETSHDFEQAVMQQVSVMKPHCNANCFARRNLLIGTLFMILSILLLKDAFLLNISDNHYFNLYIQKSPFLMFLIEKINMIYDFVHFQLYALFTLIETYKIYFVILFFLIGILWYLLDKKTDNIENRG